MLIGSEIRESLAAERLGDNGIPLQCSMTKVLPSFDGIVDAGEVLVDGAARQGDAKFMSRALDRSGIEFPGTSSSRTMEMTPRATASVTRESQCSRSAWK